jgi:hypothetical protein
MKVLKLIFLSIIFLTACNLNKKPAGILDEKQMVGLLTDLHIVDGYVSSILYVDTLKVKMTGRDYYASVYKHHNTTKPIFEKSLKYYSNQPVLLDSLYSQVERNLTAKQKRALKQEEDKQKKIQKQLEKKSK